MKKIGLKHGYYSQIVKLKRLDNPRTEEGFPFKGRTVLSGIWVNLELNWLKTNFKTREKTWYNSLFAPDVPSGTVFTVPEGASKHFNDYVL